MSDPIKGMALIDDVMAGRVIPAVLTVRCESRTVAAMVQAALSMRGYTITFLEKAPLDLSRSGPRVSEPPPHKPEFFDGHPVSNS